MGKNSRRNRRNMNVAYKRHSRDRRQGRLDWDDDGDYPHEDDHRLPEFIVVDNIIPFQESRRKKSKQARRAAHYHEAFEEIVLLEIGDYYWSVANSREPDDSTHIEAGR